MHFPDTPLHQFDPDRRVPAVVEAPPLEDFTFDDPVKEEQFQQAWHVLRTTEDPRARPSWLLFALIVGVFTLFVLDGGQFGFEQFGLLAGVIVLHELGHFVGMKLFGYTDAKLFLIPLFAVAVRGRRHTAPAWQQAATILMGPLPGLFLALGLYTVFREDSPPWVLKLVVLLTLLNGINLLPLGFTDAGRLLNLIVYSRNAWIETLMHLVSAGLFVWIAYWHENYFLVGLAVIMLLSTPTVFRMGRMTTRLRREGLQMPDTVAELLPVHGRMLFAATYDVMGPANAATRATIMRQLHDRVLVPAPGFLATVGFLLLYLAGWMATISTSYLIVEDYMQLQRRIVFPEKEPEHRWKEEATDLRRRARRLRGPARADALAKAAELEQRYGAWHGELVRKATHFQDVFAGLGPPVNQGGDDEEDEQEKDK